MWLLNWINKKHRRDKIWFKGKCYFFSLLRMLLPWLKHWIRLFMKSWKPLWIYIISSSPQWANSGVSVTLSHLLCNSFPFNLVHFEKEINMLTWVTTKDKHNPVQERVTFSDLQWPSDTGQRNTELENYRPVTEC